jgi:hypothetical protein
MKTKYKISDIEKALGHLKKHDPQCERISMDDFEKLVKNYNQAWIYNIDEIIRLLEEFLDAPFNSFPVKIDCAREIEVCEILKVKKLTLHEWRKKNFIRNIKTHNRTIRYDLHDLLVDLKKVRDKNISVKRKV